MVKNPKNKKNRISDDYFRFCFNFTDRFSMQRIHSFFSMQRIHSFLLNLILSFWQKVRYSHNSHFIIYAIFRCVNTHHQANITNVQNCTVFFFSVPLLVHKHCKTGNQIVISKTRRKEAKYAQFNTFSDNN